MEIMGSIEEIKTASSVSGAHCKCWHSDEIQNLKNTISFLVNEILDLEVTKTSDRRGASHVSDSF